MDVALVSFGYGGCLVCVMRLEPTALIFALMDETGHSSLSGYRGEIRVDIDSDETAFVLPCNKVEMTETVQQLLITKLRPLGIKWMRWWNNGHLIGRTFEPETEYD